MAVLKYNNVKVAGLSACVPKNVDSNLDGPPETLEDRQRLVKSTGICFKRYVSPGVTCSDLGFEAAEVLFKEIGWKREEIGALIMVTQSGDYQIPSTAIILQDRLGLPQTCLAFDINLGCSGYPYGMAVMAGLMESGAVKKALLVVGDKSSNSGADRSVTSLFSDCCTVTALEYVPNSEPMHFELKSDGKGFKAIYIHSGGGRHPFSAEDINPKLWPDGVTRRGTDVVLSGVDILNFAIREVPKGVEEFLKITNLTKENHNAFVFHQANLLINETIRKKLKLPPERTPMTLYDFGNTSSASVPVTIQQKLREQITTSNQRLLLCGFGVGLSWATASISFNKIVCPPLIEV